MREITTRKVTRHESTWKTVTPDDYEEAVYSVDEVRRMHKAQLGTTAALMQDDDVLIEVGCGSGRYLLDLPRLPRFTLGVDISPIAVAHLRAQFEESNPECVQILEGDASYLSNLAEAELTKRGLQHNRRIVSCVTNTLGVVPDQVRSLLLAEIALTAGASAGSVSVISVFDAAHFREGIEKLYRPNPRLCGPISPNDIDYPHCELTVESTGYHSHWFKRQELFHLVQRAGFREINIITEGWSHIAVCTSTTLIKETS